MPSIQVTLFSSHYVGYILLGIADGFRIGFNPRQKLKPARKNMRSALENLEVVKSYLQAEKDANRLLGPFPVGEIGAHISRFGVIPKKHKPGKWHLILDLSHPEDFSVNDGIQKDICSLTYLKLDEVAQVVLRLGRGALMAKRDITNAYRVVPVHPADRHLLGMRWEDGIYIDATLSFGLRSAPKIFTALADGVCWGLKLLGVRYVDHYLDDIVTVGSPESSECSDNCSTIDATLDNLGFPAVAEKGEGPTTKMDFLGRELDSVALEMRLPEAKLARLLTMLETWAGRKSCTREELQSLTGQLQHAATVVRPGRTFLRRLFDLKYTRKPHHHIRLNKEARSDLKWWQTFIRSWNGISMMPAMNSRTPDEVFTSDASGSWGLGCCWRKRWIQLEWPPQWAGKSIATKELAPLIIACAVWGRYWKGKCILAKSDNTAAVAVVNTRTSADSDMMHMLRCLFFIQAKYEFALVAAHIPGVFNDVADDISRNRAISFLSKVPDTEPVPHPLPQELIDLIILQQPDWTLPAWTQLWTSFLSKV